MKPCHDLMMPTRHLLRPQHPGQAVPKMARVVLGKQPSNCLQVTGKRLCHPPQGAQDTVIVTMTECHSIAGRREPMVPPTVETPGALRARCTQRFAEVHSSTPPHMPAGGHQVPDISSNQAAAAQRRLSLSLSLSSLPPPPRSLSLSSHLSLPFLSRSPRP